MFRASQLALLTSASSVSSSSQAAAAATGTTGTAPVAASAATRWRSLWGYRRPTWQQLLEDNNAGAWLHPHPSLARGKRKSVVEWRMHHGHGHRVGTTGVMRETADWEHSDGTPAPHANARYALRFHQHHMMGEIIRAGAAVEQAIAGGDMPRIPSSAAQRDWDPEVPLFLEDGDERGGDVRPEWFEPPRKLHAQSRKNNWLPDVPEEVGFREAEKKQLAKERGKQREHAERYERPLQNVAAGGTSSEYEPASFIDEPMYVRDNAKPHWNRRLWALSDEFLVGKPPRNKNTIGSD